MTTRDPSLPAFDLDAKQLERMRAVRLFHWQQVKIFRGRAELVAKLPTGYVNERYREYMKVREAELNAKANEHLGYVQTLNEYFQLGDYAEHDDVEKSNG